jgi:hypothetical protein
VLLASQENQKKELNLTYSALSPGLSLIKFSSATVTCTLLPSAFNICMSASALGGSDPKDGEPVPEDNCFFSPISFPCGRVVPNRLVKVFL